MKPFSRLLTAIGTFFALLIGQFSWKRPNWLKSLCQKVKSRPGVFWGMVSGLVILLAIAFYGYHWYQNIPKPKLITAYITAPKITPVIDELIPDNLNIDFGLAGRENEGFTAQSVAPLKQINKEVTEGITMTPAIQGKWYWQNDNHLTFTPSQDWPAGQTYQIHFDKSVFAAKKKMAKMDYAFSTQPFLINIAEFKFYQDPENSQLRQAVATIHFNYPVNTTNFESNISLMLQALANGKLNLNAKRFKYTVSYDEHKRTAYLHSEALPVSDVERYLLLTISKGVKPIAGPSVTTEDVTKTVLIPDVGSYFKVSNTSAEIVRNEQDRPEQVLTVETTLGVTEADINKALHVYLLPQDYPATGTEAEKKNYEWQDPGEVTPDMLKLSTPLTTQTIPADRDYSTLHSYKFSTSTPRYIYLKLDKGVRGFGDFALANDYVAVIKVPEYPQEIGFLHKGALLALSSEKKLSVVIRGVPAVKFQIARVLPDDINHLITQTNGTFDNPQFYNDSFNQQNISEIFSEIQQFDTTDLSKSQYSALDFGKYLSAKANGLGPQGLFLLKATGWDVEKKSPLEVNASRLILITDLGLLVKDNIDGSHDVFVESITQGTPVANTTVSILGKNGLPILTRTTDADGHVNFPTVKDFTDEREPVVYIAKSGNDVAFIPFNNYDRQLNFSRFDIGGIYSNNQELKTLSAYLFSDRGIYRPGDTAHIGMIVKQIYAQPQPVGLSVQATVTDPRGVTVNTVRYTLDAIGLLTQDFNTQATSPTGLYTVNLFIVKDNQPSSLLGSTSFRVQEFLPDRMRITAHLSKESTKGWISPSDLSATVDLWNLYGAPAANRKMTARILLAPQHIQFKEYPKYTFFDPLFDPNKPPKVFDDTLTETETNDQGQANFDLKLDRFDKATYQLTFFAEGFEAAGGRSVKTQTTTLVSPLDYFIGYKPDGDLNYIKQNSQRSINLIAVDPQLKQQAATDLKIQLIALRPVTTLVKKEDGTYQYQSIIQSSVLSTTPFSVSEQGIDYTVNSEKIGDFALVILDPKNTELSRIKFSVVGESQQPLAKNAELSVKLNKSEYNTDEDIELQITAPYTGSGLISIERDKVYAYQWFKTNSTNSVQKIHIPKDFQGNGYVNVAFVRDWDSPEIFMSPLSYNVIPFSVNHDNHAIKIDLDTPALAKPGEPFTIQYKSDKPGKIIVYAVDEGILQVTDYHTPDPLGFFFDKRALEVLTQQTVDQILPKFIAERELSAVGGDGGAAAALRANLNPFKRKTDLPVVYWSNIVDTDSTARQLVYQVPDYFNGTLRVMAVAVATDAVGSTSKSSEVRGDFVINPNVPTFVAPGDEFEITASVANNVKDSGTDASVTVKLDVTPQLEIINSAKQELKISEGHEGTAHFKLRAKSNLGSAAVTLTANTAAKSSKMTATLSVRPANPYLTTIMSGSSSESNQFLNLDRVMYSEERNVEAAISSNPLILIFGLDRYLENYPFGCTEQLVSKAFPLLVMSNQPWFNKDPSKLNNKVQATIQMLGQRQLSSGGFSYWPSAGDNSSNTFASVYAMHFLTEARGFGFDVPSDMLHAGMGYLKELAAQNVSSMDQARVQAYAIYILTRNEIVTTNYLTNLQLYLDQNQAKAWHSDITSAYIAATYQLLKSYADATKLIYYFKPKSPAIAVNDFYNNNDATAQYLYLLARHFPDLLAKGGSELVLPLVTAMNSGEINTIFSSYASIALSAYGQAHQVPNDTTFSITETVADDKQKTLVSPDSSYEKVSVDDLAKKINFANPSKQQFFYQLTQTGFDKDLPSKPIKQGLEIYREYRNSQGTVLDKAHLGDEVEVHIQVRALDDRYLSNVAIIDLLPGGFEVVSDSVHQDGVDYADAREDRVVFFAYIDSTAKEIVYRIKATNVGKYTIPPVFANAMYDPSVKARGVAGNLSVVE